MQIVRLLCPCLPIVRLCPANAVKGVRFASMNCSALIGPAVLDGAGRQAFPPSIKGGEALRQELYKNSLATIPLFPAGQIVARPERSRYWNRRTDRHWSSSRAIFAVTGAISARTTSLKTN
jgi:hypothetical protein